MATGRMIVNAICADKRINQLSDDTSRLAFTWLITFADREGRTYGDPGVVRSMLFPRRQDVSIEQMAAYITEWNALGLVVWYEADGDKWLFFPTFEKNQPGMRKEKEAPSRIPPPPGAGTPEVRSEDGVSTPEVPLKGIKGNRKEEGADAAASTPPTPPVSEFHDAVEITAFQKVTSMNSYPGTNRELILDAMNALRLQYPTVELLVAYLQPFFDEWIGRGYARSNCAWLYDWALSGEIPPVGKKQGAAKTMTEEEVRRSLRL